MNALEKYAYRVQGRSNLCHCQKVTTCKKSSLSKAPPSVRLKGENLTHHVRRLSADVQTEVVEGLEVRLGKVTFNFNHQSMLIIRCFARHIYYMWVNCLAGLPCTGCSWWSRYSSRQGPERDNWLNMSMLLFNFSLQLTPAHWCKTQRRVQGGCRPGQHCKAQQECWTEGEIRI